MRYKVPNYLSNSARAAMRFGGDVWNTVLQGVYLKPWGTPGYKSQGMGDVASKVGDAIGRTIGSEEFRSKYVWPYTTGYRVVSKAAGEAAKNIPLSRVGQAAVAVGTPVLYHQLTETSGPIYQGMRPKGWKAAVPASKEVDPTGKTPISLPEEAAARWVLGQKSQLLPYGEFVKERPDVMPSTLANYRGYMSKKPKAGERFNIDLDKGSFTALGGAVRGTSRGLHDPEIRLRGVPISLNATLGTAAGLGTIAAGAKHLNLQNEGLDAAVRVAKAGVEKEGGKVAQELYDAARTAKQEWVETLPKAAQEFQKLGKFKEPALLAGGVLAAVGTAATARKLFQKAEENRIKKEDPVEYLKYKHGDFANAKEAMKQPEARNWQELSQSIN